MKRLLDIHLKKRTGEVNGAESTANRKYDPAIANCTDLQTLHEAYQFLMRKYVDGVEQNSERSAQLQREARKKRDTLDIAKSKPVLLGNLLDMPSR